MSGVVCVYGKEARVDNGGLLTGVRIQGVLKNL